MPVRTVPKNYRSLTGLVPNTRTQSMTAFESSLERDFLLLLDFDPDVEFYEEQPVKITYHDDRGRRRTYTPDVFVRYRTDRLQAQHTQPHLWEVKYRDDLRQHWAEYRPKFRVTQRYARQRGWRFRVVTERHVRTPYLDNVKFLETIASLPGFGMAPIGHLSYSAGPTMRARRTQPCAVRVRIDPIPAKG